MNERYWRVYIDNDDIPAVRCLMEGGFGLSSDVHFAIVEQIVAEFLVYGKVV